MEHAFDTEAPGIPNGWPYLISLPHSNTKILRCISQVLRCFSCLVVILRGTGHLLLLQTIVWVLVASCDTVIGVVDIADMWAA